MSKPIHTSGPIELRGIDKTILVTFNAKGNKDAPVLLADVDKPGDARLLAAAYNAFDSAAKKLGVNAVLLAEGLQHGGIADLIAALEQAREHIDGEIDVVDRDYGVPAPNKAMSLAQEIDAALAKVKGGPT